MNRATESAAHVGAGVFMVLGVGLFAGVLSALAFVVGWALMGLLTPLTGGM